MDSLSSVRRIPLRALPSPGDEARALCRDLGPLVGGRASVANDDRIAYSRDLWPKAVIWTRAGQMPRPPDVVVWPSTIEEVAAVTRRARELGVPLIPYGAGSGVCGGTIPLQGGIVMDLKRLSRIRRVDVERLELDCEAGIIGENLERRLNKHGVSLGHFPSSIYCSTLGGWLAARSAGQCSNRYGKIEDMVASMTVVDGRGEIHTTPRRPLPGADVNQLLVGSEGTLATICSATLHMVPTPETRAFRGFRFRKVADGVEAMRALFRAGVRPAVVRLYDPFDTALVGKGREGKGGGGFHSPSWRERLTEQVAHRLKQRLTTAALGRPMALNRAADLLADCLLVLVFEGPADLCDLEAAEGARICALNGGEDLGPEPGRIWMEKRYAVSYKQSKVFDMGAFVDTMEVAASWDRVVEVYDRVREAVSPHAFVMCHFSHAYVEGCCLYFSFAGAGGSLEESERRYDRIWREALQAAQQAGANVSHHHGVGFAKADALARQLGEGGMKALRALKATWDPDGIMNPGKLGLS